MRENEVKTVFTVVDEANGPLTQISKNSEMVKTKAEQAQKALGGISGPMGMGGAGAQGPSAQSRLKAFNEENKEMIEEAALRRKRLRLQRANLMEEKGMRHGMQAMTMLMMGKQEGFAGALERTSGMVMAAGLQFSGMDGKLGQFGVQLANLGANVGILAGTFEVGHSIGEGFNQASEWLVNKAEKGSSNLAQMADAAIGFVPVVNVLYAAATAEARAHNEVVAATKQYVKALGYRSVQEYEAMQALNKRVGGEDRLNAVIEDEVKAGRIAAETADNSAEARATLHAKHMKEALEVSRKTGAPVEVAYKKIETASANLAESIFARANQEQQMREFNARWHAIHRTLLPPINASMEDITKAYKIDAEALQAEAIKHGFSVEMAGKMAEMQVQHNAAMQETINSTLEESVGHARVRAVLAKVPKHTFEMMQKMMESGKSLDEMKAAITVTAMDLMAKGGITDPAMQLEFMKSFMRLSTPKLHIHNDYRGSRFSINQQFAEGFDPDRVSVAMINDISMRGERQLQSNYAPVGGVR